MICHSRKLALRLKHFAQWRKSAQASLRKPRHYRPACSFVLSSVTLRLIVTAESYISGADSIKFLSYQLPPYAPGKIFGDFKWNKEIFSFSSPPTLTSLPSTNGCISYRLRLPDTERPRNVSARLCRGTEPYCSEALDPAAPWQPGWGWRR